MEKFYIAIANNGNNSGRKASFDEARSWAEDHFGKIKTATEVMICQSIGLLRPTNPPLEFTPTHEQGAIAYEKPKAA